jgi:uncharacterized repeat protein (TIGR01451 family)
MRMKRTTRCGIAALAVLMAGATAASAGQIQPPGVTFSVASDDSGHDTAVAQCSANGYFLTVTNQTASDVTVLQFTDKLYSGFSYVPGSTTLTDTDTGVSVPVPDPNISSGGGTTTLQYPASVTVPANDSVVLHFDVIVLDRSDPAVKAPNKAAYPNHAVVKYGGDLSGVKIGQNTSIRVSKVASDCAI